MAAVALAMSGCTSLLVGDVTIVKQEQGEPYRGKGCTITVARMNVKEWQLDGAPAAEPSKERRHALQYFASGFYDSMSNVDPAHVVQGDSGALVVRPTFRRAKAGSWFVDAAGTPTEVWVELEVHDRDGSLIETFEAHGVESANKRQPTFEDRLPLAGLQAGTTAGKYLRKKLSCR